MDKKPIITQILAELSIQAQSINQHELIDLTDQIKQANHLFLSGAGRSGIMISAFANRLMHLGLNVSLVNEITKPKANQGDLLIIASGSGETGSLISHAQKAKQLGLNIALITMNKNSTLATLADKKVILPSGINQFAQPMGSTFEQLSLLSYDSMVIMLAKSLNQSFDAMQQRHANIE